MIIMLLLCYYYSFNIINVSLNTLLLGYDDYVYIIMLLLLVLLPYYYKALLIMFSLRALFLLGY